jgi:hypothetical protein
MITPEASERLLETFRQIAMFIMIFVGTLAIISIFLIALGLYFSHKSKLAKEAKSKKRFKILSIICWILAIPIIGFLIWLYIH